MASSASWGGGKARSSRSTPTSPFARVVVGIEGVVESLVGDGMCAWPGEQAERALLWALGSSNGVGCWMRWSSLTVILLWLAPDAKGARLVGAADARRALGLPALPWLAVGGILRSGGEEEGTVEPVFGSGPMMGATAIVYTAPRRGKVRFLAGSTHGLD